jgi:hypothetical protein
MGLAATTDSTFERRKVGAQVTNPGAMARNAAGGFGRQARADGKPLICTCDVARLHGSADPAGLSNSPKQGPVCNACGLKPGRQVAHGVSGDIPHRPFPFLIRLAPADGDGSVAGGPDLEIGVS